MTGKGLVFLLLSFSILASCSPLRVRLVNRATGHVVECMAISEQPLSRSQTSIERSVEHCARQWESVGYVRGENLPREQKAAVYSVPLH